VANLGDRLDMGVLVDVDLVAARRTLDLAPARAGLQVKNGSDHGLRAIAVRLSVQALGDLAGRLDGAGIEVVAVALASVLGSIWCMRPI
jgi:hypothetical protein